jgi:hypothetical protein
MTWQLDYRTGFVLCWISIAKQRVFIGWDNRLVLFCLYRPIGSECNRNRFCCVLHSQVTNELRIHGERKSCTKLRRSSHTHTHTHPLAYRIFYRSIIFITKIQVASISHLFGFTFIFVFYKRCFDPPFPIQTLFCKYYLGFFLFTQGLRFGELVNNETFVRVEKLCFRAMDETDDGFSIVTVRVIDRAIRTNCLDLASQSRLS